jgi:hypothetical protein
MRRELATTALLLTVLAGCRTAAPPAGGAPLEEGIAALTRPLPGELAALYRLRVPGTGTLRLTVATRGPAGRLSVSEPFAGAVSVAAWDDSASPARLYDLREGCRVEASSLTAVLGVGRLPLPQAARLLAGRLPALEGDRLSLEPEARAVDVAGASSSYRATLAQSPWRVTRVAGDGWSVALDRHTVSVPGSVRVEHADGRWAELELLRLEWPEDPSLPEEPELPSCAAAAGAAR